jgi:hypothetical protein
MSSTIRATLWLAALCTALAAWQLIWPSAPRSTDDGLTRLLRAALGREGPGLFCAALALFFHACAAAALWRRWRGRPPARR